MHDHRRALINGLLNLAIFLETHPDVPISISPVAIRAFPAKGPDDQMRAEVEKVAALLGTEIDPAHVPHGHYMTGIDFGPVHYEFIAILAAARALHAAQDSYRDCITPDNT
ncbi:hypothetical protein ITP53_10940 [Nonomuraea sp. K274]|uniref:Uncharacterized protein n=1 Tax=Nonomuraea cypriaca TaxID=1187855 RepID=A0A931A4R7_9ACTN|nr:hypothetical protein [Nonomuraea cypriaca]MBF8186252.1 hypothetical protein [Nonomuraea cypriaca]